LFFATIFPDQAKAEKAAKGKNRYVFPLSSLLVPAWRVGVGNSTFFSDPEILDSFVSISFRNYGVIEYSKDLPIFRTRVEAEDYVVNEYSEMLVYFKRCSERCVEIINKHGSSAREFLLDLK
jgi:hypothetical protein